MPLTTSPQTIASPDIAYDKALVSLSIRGAASDSSIKAGINFSVQKYRVLPDNSIEVSGAAPTTLHYDDAFISAASDPDLAAAVAAIETALQAFITAKGF